MRLLLVTETPPGTPNGFGVTLKNLFSGIKHDTLFTDINFRKSTIKKDFIFAHCPYHSSKKGIILFLLGLIPEWRGYYSKTWMFFFLRKKYDLVYAFFYSVDCAVFAHRIAKYKSARLIIHIADHNKAFIASKKFREIVKFSTKVCCIGKNMRDFYEKEFCRKFEIFHNLADDAFLPLLHNINPSFSKTNPLKLLFIGSLFESLHKGTINNICEVIKELNDEGYPIIFNLYGQIVPTSFLSRELTSSHIQHHGTIPSEERFNIMSANHCFIVPSSFNQNIKDEYRYSIPTKLPELLLSGRPVIIHGPKEMEAYRYCTENKCGIVIDENSIVTLKSKFIEIFNNYADYNNQAFKTSHNLKKHLSISLHKSNFHNFVLN